MEYYKNIHAIGFTLDELKEIFSRPIKQELLDQVLGGGFLPGQLLKNLPLMRQLVSNVKAVKDKEDYEIFVAVYILTEIWNNCSHVCFKIREGVNPMKAKTHTLGWLKSIIKENDLSDFGFKCSDGYRDFQLKRYMGSSRKEEVFSFLKKKLLHYGNNLGDVNLLIVLQGKDGAVEGDIFNWLHGELLKINLKGGGHVLMLYNESGAYTVVNTLFPILGTTRVRVRNSSL